MSLFDLLFVLLVLTAVGTMVVVLVHTLRGRRQRAGALLRRVAIVTVVYLVIVLGVGVLAPQRILSVGDPQCFDDWCVTIDSVSILPQLGERDPIAPAGAFYIVALHLSNGGRGRPQRASSAVIYLRDGHGRRYDVSLDGQRAFEGEHGAAAPLTATVLVGRPVETVRVFDAPADAEDLGVVVRHPVGPSPGLFVIGDDFSLLHKPAIVRVR